MPRQASEDLIAAVKQFEGFLAVAEKDPGGVWTLGYGNTNGITEGMTTTEHQADLDLRSELASKAEIINSFITVSPTQPEFDALLDFAFNVGANAEHGSTLLKLLDEGDFVDAAKQFPRWDHCGQEVLDGLYIRRMAEQSWFTGIEPVSYPSPEQQDIWLADLHKGLTGSEKWK